MSDIQGTYSMVAASVAGCSVATVVFANGNIEGNDIAGSRYLGTYSPAPDGILLSLEITFPPDVFGIFGTSLSETFQTRSITVVVPPSFFEGAPYEPAGYGMTVIARRIPDEFAPLAGANGIDHMISSLQSAKANWARYNSRA